MTRTTMIKSFTALVLAVQVSGAIDDEIIVRQPRPMMALAGELAVRYGYLVTYEDGPTDSEDVVLEPGRNSPEYRYPRWKAAVFHVGIHETTLAESPTEEPLRSRFIGSVQVRGTGAIRALSPGIVDPLVDEYNASGNPGRFTVLYEGDYAHIVPAGQWSSGSQGYFEPILSTKIALRLRQGACLDVFQDLLAEIRQARGVQIMVAEAPTNALRNGQCSIKGDSVVAREALVQLLDQAGVHPAFFGLPNDRFVWTFVYDPTTNSYWLSTRLMPGRPIVAGPARTETEVPVPSKGAKSTAPNPFGRSQ